MERTGRRAPVRDRRRARHGAGGAGRAVAGERPRSPPAPGSVCPAARRTTPSTGMVRSAGSGSRAGGRRGGRPPRGSTGNAGRGRRDCHGEQRGQGRGGPRGRRPVRDRLPERGCRRQGPGSHGREGRGSGRRGRSGRESGDGCRRSAGERRHRVVLVNLRPRTAARLLPRSPSRTCASTSCRATCCRPRHAAPPSAISRPGLRPGNSRCESPATFLSRTRRPRTKPSSPGHADGKVLVEI